MRGGRSVVVALVLVLAVCGSAACQDSADDDDGARGNDDLPTVDQTTARVATWFTAQSDPNGLTFTSDEADCAAEAVVDGLGVARIEELRDRAANTAGSPDEGFDLLQEPPLATDEADVVYAAMTGCIDFKAQVAEVLAAGGQPDAKARCMAERYLETDVPRDAIMSARTSPDLMAEITTTLAEIDTACGSG